jgi:hypothetical protein
MRLAWRWGNWWQGWQRPLVGGKGVAGGLTLLGWGPVVTVLWLKCGVGLHANRWGCWRAWNATSCGYTDDAQLASLPVYKTI